MSSSGHQEGPSRHSVRDGAGGPYTYGSRHPVAWREEGQLEGRPHLVSVLGCACPPTTVETHAEDRCRRARRGRRRRLAGPRLRPPEGCQDDFATPFATPIQREGAERPVRSGAGNAVTRTFAGGVVSSGDPYRFRNVEVGGSNPLTSTTEALATAGFLPRAAGLGSGGVEGDGVRGHSGNEARGRGSYGLRRPRCL